jgi:hypothetical protein
MINFKAFSAAHSQFTIYIDSTMQKRSKSAGAAAVQAKIAVTESMYTYSVIAMTENGRSFGDCAADASAKHTHVIVAKAMHTCATITATIYTITSRTGAMDTYEPAASKHTCAISAGARHTCKFDALATYTCEVGAFTSNTYTSFASAKHT